MARYTVIGGDQKEYNLVSAEDMRKWIAEGRLNANTLAKAEGDVEFRPLGGFPEFVAALAAAAKGPTPAQAPSLPAGGGNRDAALQQVKGPAIALKVTAILNILLAVWSLVKLTFFHVNFQQLFAGIPEFNDPQIQSLLNLAYGPLGVMSDLFGLAISILVLIGASKMQSLRSYGFAFAAAILAMIPCLTPCCLLGLPFGIWALVVLNRPEVKSHFT